MNSTGPKDFSKRIRRLCVISSTRADWGLLSPVARGLRELPGIEISVLATNMHLLEEYGHTIDEIRADGFDPVPVEMNVPGADATGRAMAMGLCTITMAKALDRFHPDAVLLLGDRYEILGATSAAAVMTIPIIHIAGGEISEGAIDDSLRHAITKLSTLHLAATEAYRKRIIQMGEDPERVINTGAIGVWNALHVPLISMSELSESINFDLSTGPIAAVTFHPATLDSQMSPLRRFMDFLEALDSVKELRCVITYPNNDAHGQELIPILESYAASRPERIRALPSLGMRRYLSLLAHADVCAGNSSSGIVEAPSFGIATVDVGIRQRGRISAPSVIHCGDSSREIADALHKALSPDFRNICARRQNPYFQPDTLPLMLRSIANFMNTLPCGQKKFYDLP